MYNRMYHRRKEYVSLFLLLLLLGCGGQRKSSLSEEGMADRFVTVRNGQFIRAGKPYYFIGTNCWYGPILGAQGEFGDRNRLQRELDVMKANGITNIRILAGADGPEGIPFRILPTLQKTPGVYDESLLDGLDFFMKEVADRGMYAVIYLTNNWDWSGGYAQYLHWAGHGVPPAASADGWQAFSEYISDFYSNDSCKALFKKHIAFILGRTNYYNQLKYTDDPHILSWQIANEPRPMEAENKAAFEAWIKEIAAYIKSLDPNHLVSTGSEGEMGCEGDIGLYERIHTDPNIDYLTLHIWPKNWGWLDTENMKGSMDGVLSRADDYMKKHIALAERLKKPIVLEEFGLPRDEHRYDPAQPTSCRDRYYRHLFEQLRDSKEKQSVWAGCNFWAWGGLARPHTDHLFWRIGDDYMGDPGQEEQGLNSVFDTDATLSLIRSYALPLADFATEK